MPKTKKGIDFEVMWWDLCWQSILDTDGNRVWGPSSDPMKNLRKAFKNHYLRDHTVMDIPWCVMTQDQRASKSFMGADDEDSGEETVGSDEIYERSDESDDSESSDYSD